MGEASEDVHSFIDYVADQRAKHERTLDLKGRIASTKDEARITAIKGEIHQILSMEINRSQARLTIDRASQAGASTVRANQRRGRAMMVEANL